MTSTATAMTAQLTAADRCDRCAAQAYVRVTLPAGQLFFCAHHGRALAPSLQHIATEIHDESHRLLATASDGR